MRMLGNILWHFPFLGFLSAFGTFLIGGLLVITVIASPIGFGLIELSKFLLAPFSSAMISKYDLNIKNDNFVESYWVFVRIIYFPIGLFLSIIIIIQIALSFITIIGIPIAIVSAKSLSTFFNPVNKKCVPIAVMHELESKKAKKEVDKYLSVQPVVS